MARILETLRREHSETATLLELLERELARFNADGEGETNEGVDYELVGLIVQYLTDYPERCHHPLEELVLERLEASYAERMKEIGGLRAEHVALTGHLRQVEEVVEMIYRDLPLEAARFEEAIRELVDFLRDHMRREELMFFPMADTLLTDRDWREIEARATIEADPLYGDSPRDKFRRLREMILEWGGEKVSTRVANGSS